MTKTPLHRSSLKNGLVIGLLLTLTLAFVIVTDVIKRVLPGWNMLNIPWMPNDVLRITSIVASAVMLLFVGTYAAIRVRPDTLKEGFKAGALSGLVVGIVVYAFLLSPLAVVGGGGPMYQELLRGAAFIREDVLERLVYKTVIQTGRISMGLAVAAPLLGMVLGGVEGFIYTLLRRAGGSSAEEEEYPVLLDRVQQEKPFSLPDREERALKAGLLGGLIVGGFFVLELYLGFTQVFVREMPEELRRMVEHRMETSPETAEWLGGLAGLLLLFVPIALLLWGGLGVLLLKHPPTRFGSRFRTSILGGATAGTIFTVLIGLPLFNVILAVAPLFVSQEEGVSLTLENMHQMVRGLLFYPLIPLVLLLLWALLGLFTGLPFVFVLPFFWPRRPVDRAAGLVRQIRQQPESLLPQVYALFQRDRQAVEVLQHMGQRLHRGGELTRKRSKKVLDLTQHMSQGLGQGGDQPAAIVVAAYHTIYQHPERMREAIRAIAHTVAENPGWRWRTEIGELYRFLAEGLGVRSIHHLTAIRPLPEEQTSSLPAMLSQMGEHLSRAVAEVKKAHRLDDPNSRSILLTRVQEEISEAERFLGEKMAQGRKENCPKGKSDLCATPYPEHEVMAVLLPLWRDVIYDALRDLRGRAILQLELQTRQASYLPQLSLHLRVANEGLNVAEQVRIGLEASPDYRLTEESEARIELLPPGEERVVRLKIEPRKPRSIRVQLRVLYNDAVEENRELALADEVLFVESDRPFQRIFPIPYVTGTPLKTQDMFFGRQDVFDYVQEHLLGAYQNNIIVLHGQRRTGKTSVLYQLSEVMRESHYGVLLDMQGIAARSEPEFFYALSDEIAYVLEREGLDVELPQMDEYESQPEFTFRSRFLRSLYALLGGKHLLLMFDEFEELERHVEEGHIGPGLFSFLRNLMQHEGPVDFIFSGTHKLEDLAGEYWSILFNIATYKKISFLAEQDVQRLVVDPVAAYGMEYDPMAVAHIYEVTAGQPFLTQMVCHEMVAYHNESERSYLTVADVDAVLERIAERGEAHFKYIWDGSNADDRAVLLALAELLTHAVGATVQDVVELSERRGRGLGREQALAALVRLESRDIITRTSLGAERFRFYVDLVRRWIACNPQLADTIELV